MAKGKPATVEGVRGNFLSEVENVRAQGEGWRASCPVPGHGQGRGDRNPSLSVDEGEDRLLVNCQAGCPTETVLEAIGWTMADLFPRPNGKVVNLKAIKGGKEAEGCTLEGYAEKTGLPLDFLKDLGLEDRKHQGKPAVRIPYYDEEGREKRHRWRTALEKSPQGGDPRFKWGSGTETLPYGLEQLYLAKEAGYAVLVEGESDQQTLRHHEVRSLGVPGANNWKPEWAEYLRGIEKVYVVVEPDRGGAVFEEALGRTPLKDRLWSISLEEHKDPNALYLSDPENFLENFRTAAQNAVPYQEREKEAAEESAKDYWEECKDLALSEDILAEFEKDVKAAGVVGQEREAKIIYLAALTRHFETPTSVVVKGPSSGGKSFTLNKVLEFQPEESYYKLSAMSDKALAHFDKPLKHRHLVIAEAAAMEGSEMATYLIRTLLSEGYLHYIYPLPTPEGIELYEVRVEGPTGLFLTTTEISLHAENETRLLSVPVSDTKAQTEAVMRGTVEKRRRRRRGEETPDVTKRWHALARWLAMAGTKKVEVSYDRWLSRQIPAVAVRLRRDFEQVLNLVEAHAILHQASREKNEYGDVVATREDYAAVRELLSDLLSEQLEAAVPPEVRETVEVLENLYEELENKSDGIHGKKLADALGIHKSSASRRIQNAQRRGFVKNLEAGNRGVKARYVPDDPLPEDIVVLPKASEIPEECCTVARVARSQALHEKKYGEDSAVYPVDNPDATAQHPANTHNTGENEDIFFDATLTPPATPATVQRSAGEEASGKDGHATVQHPNKETDEEMWAEQDRKMEATMDRLGQRFAETGEKDEEGWETI